MTTGRYACGRLGLGALQILVLGVVVFILAAALPGDAAVTIAGDDPDPRRVAAIRQRLGLDQPLLTQLGDWLTQLFRGELGTSLISGRTVASMITAAVGPTLTLAGLALAVLAPAALILGLIAATRRGGTVDRLISTVCVGVYAVPEFAFAVLMIAAFAVWLNLLPATAIGAGPDLILHPELWLLPVIVLAARPICSLTRVVRSSVASELDAEYVGHLRSLGVPSQRILWRHVLPAAAAPITQQVARIADWLLGGVIVVEAVFAVGGLGQLMIAAVTSRDLPIILGLVITFGAITVTVNTAADIVARWLSPRSVHSS
ncbi:ABC transporter permease [Mycolicibacterium nivoides]|uniref:ABC transporter permease n=1 Tax=Mycolicibacterium nivoides TaxID=2487344 RepID=UPI003C2B9D93